MRMFKNVLVMLAIATVVVYLASFGGIFDRMEIWKCVMLGIYYAHFVGMGVTMTKA